MDGSVPERKVHEDEAARMRRRVSEIERVLESVSDAYVELDDRWRFSFVNKKAAALIGREAHELMGRHVWDLFPEAKNLKFFTETRRAVQTGELVTFEEYYPPQDRWYEVRVFPGEIGFWAFFTDITKRKRAFMKIAEYREQLEEAADGRADELESVAEMLKHEIIERQHAQGFTQSILESLEEGLLVVDREYRILEANRAYCEQVGMSAEAVRGRLCFELQGTGKSPCYYEGERCAVKEAFRTGEPATAVRSMYFGPDGPTYVEVKAYPMRDGDGTVTSAIEIIRDITDKHRLEEQLRHSQKMEAVGQLAGGIAHDFNNRLAAIMNYCYILKTGMKPDDPLLVHVNQILSSSERAAHLTQNLLTFSRKQVINPRPVRLNAIVEGIESLLHRVIGERVGFTAELSADDPVVMADSGQIEHVLMNLATNARDAIDDRGQVTVRTWRVDIDVVTARSLMMKKPGAYAGLSFSDSGSGMPGATREKVFEPFFTTKSGSTGTGLGLSIVYGIVRQHSGHIDVASTPGAGTTVTIYLPLLATRIVQPEATEQPKPRGGRETILVAEDDADVRNPVLHVLEGHGYAVIEAVDGDDALEQFRRHGDKVDLLLFDVMMPGRTGQEVLENIRKTAPNVKAIFTSGYSGEYIRSKGLLDTDEILLPKPVASEVLLQKVREVLDS